MAPFPVQLTRSAEKELSKLPREAILRFAAAIDRLREDPTHARPGVDVKRLKGARSAWRLRVGDYRGIYEVEGDRVVFTRFARRSKVYRV